MIVFVSTIKHNFTVNLHIMICTCLNDWLNECLVILEHGIYRMFD